MNAYKPIIVENKKHFTNYTCSTCWKRVVVEREVGDEKGRGQLYSYCAGLPISFQIQGVAIEFFWAQKKKKN